MASTPRRGPTTTRAPPSKPGGGAPAAAAGQSMDADLIEPVPPTLKKFHPGKGALLVRKVEEVASPTSRPSSSSSLLHPIGSAVMGAADCVRDERVIALGPKGIYLSDIGGTVLRVVVYEDVVSLSCFQKFFHIGLSGRGDEAKDLLLCFSPFPVNSRNNPRDVIDIISGKCNKSVVVEHPTPEVLGLHGIDTAAKGSPHEPPSRQGASASSPVATPLLSPFTDYSSRDWTHVVESLYQTVQPSKMAEVPALLEKFAGKEQSLVLGILKKYNVPNGANLIARIGRADATREQPAVELCSTESRALPPSPPAIPIGPSEVSASDSRQPLLLEQVERHPSNAAAVPPWPSAEEQRKDREDEARLFQRALEAASNATDDFAVQPSRDNEAEEEEESRQRYSEWNAQDNDVNVQWDPSHLEERIAEAAADVDDDWGGAQCPESQTIGDTSEPEVDDAVEAVAHDGNTNVEYRDEDTWDHQGDGAEEVPSTYSALFDPSARKPAPSPPLAMENDNPYVERFVARRIHLPSLEQHEPAEYGAFETVDQLPPSSYLSNDHMTVYKPFETRSRSPELLVARPLHDLATPVRHHSHALSSRRVFGGGSSSVRRDPVVNSGGSGGSVDGSPAYGDEPSDAEWWPAWETRDKESVVKSASPVPEPNEPVNEVASPTAEHNAPYSVASAKLTSPSTITSTIPSLVPPMLFDAALLRNTPEDTTTSVRVPHSLAAAGKQSASRISGPQLDSDEGLPVAHLHGSIKGLGRYFLSANATEAMQLLRPINTASSNASNAADACDIDCQELMAIAVNILKQARQRAPSSAAQRSTGQQLYQSWSVEVQARCFLALEAFISDEWSITSFLNALAPLVDYRFDSVVLTLKGNVPVAKRESPDGKQRARRQMHCPQLLFESFVAAWDTRSRLVLKVTSRHGCITLADVSHRFLEFVDRYTSYGQDQEHGGDHSSPPVPGNSPRPYLSSSIVTSRLLPSSRRAAMEADVRNFPDWMDPALFPKQRTAPAADFSSLWAKGNVLMRVFTLPFHGSGGSPSVADLGSDDIGDHSIAGGTSSLPLAEWNDLVSRWNAAEGA